MRHITLADGKRFKANGNEVGEGYHGLSLEDAAELEKRIAEQNAQREYNGKVIAFKKLVETVVADNRFGMGNDYAKLSDSQKSELRTLLESL